MSNTYNCVTVTACAGSRAICLSIDHGGTIGLFHHTLWVTNLCYTRAHEFKCLISSLEVLSFSL